MDITQAQLQVLKNDILADPLLAQWAATGRMAQEISVEYNKPASPVWVVWRTAVQPDEWRGGILNDAAGGADQLDNLTIGKRDSLLWFFEGVINPSLPNVRATLNSLCGTQNNLKAAIATIQKRIATRAEKLFSIGTGSTASPATMTFEGAILLRATWMQR